MEEKNNSKQILLSIIGIAVLIIAVIGISFAFFSYSRTGSSSNLITTGQIYMEFKEGVNSISLTNQFPMTNTEAASYTPAVNESNVMNFTVEGYFSGTGTIDYTIYAVAGTATGAAVGKDRFQNSEISVIMTKSSNTTAGGNAITNNISAATPVNNLVDSTGWAIATGQIQGGTSSSNKQIDTYQLKMWVNETVRISDTNTTVTWSDATTQISATKYCASPRVMSEEPLNYEGEEPFVPTYVGGCKLYLNNQTVTIANDTDDTDDHTYLKVYNNMYYSLKLKVEGHEAVLVTPAQS